MLSIRLADQCDRAAAASSFGRPLSAVIPSHKWPIIGLELRLIAAKSAFSLE